MYCMNCGEHTDTEIRAFPESYAVRGEEITVDSCVRICLSCGCEMFDEDLDGANLKRAFDKYRAKHDLLTTHDIMMIRQRYGMSQEGFAYILGMEPGKIKSLERGSLPTVCENNLILLMKKPRNFAMLLERRKSGISEEEYIVAKAVVGCV